METLTQRLKMAQEQPLTPERVEQIKVLAIYETVILMAILAAIIIVVTVAAYYIRKDNKRLEVLIKNN